MVLSVTAKFQISCVGPSALSSVVDFPEGIGLLTPRCLPIASAVVSKPLHRATQPGGDRRCSSLLSFSPRGFNSFITALIASCLMATWTFSAPRPMWWSSSTTYFMNRSLPKRCSADAPPTTFAGLKPTPRIITSRCSGFLGTRASPCAMNWSSAPLYNRPDALDAWRLLHPPESRTGPHLPLHPTPTCHRRPQLSHDPARVLSLPPLLLLPRRPPPRGYGSAHRFVPPLPSQRLH